MLLELLLGLGICKSSLQRNFTLISQQLAMERINSRLRTGTRRVTYKGDAFGLSIRINHDATTHDFTKTFANLFQLIIIHRQRQTGKINVTGTFIGQLFQLFRYRLFGHGCNITKLLQTRNSFLCFVFSLEQTKSIAFTFTVLCQ